VSISQSLEQMLDEGAPLDAEGQVYADLARSLAAALDDAGTAAYSRPNLARQFRGNRMAGNLRSTKATCLLGLTRS
jgi:hypothetical protein